MKLEPTQVWVLLCPLVDWGLLSNPPALSPATKPSRFFIVADTHMIVANN